MNFDKQVTAILPVIDMQRARRFYERQLGLKAGAAKPDGKFVYHCSGTEIALFPRPGGTKAEHTALSFKVDNIRAAVDELEGRGVKFADYDLPGLKTVEHVCVLGSEKAAWFQDPEGNILCLHEDLNS
jgi:catechol 2,3-dioxygenase-like lactoylglutathione lyase family enzyme